MGDIMRTVYFSVAVLFAAAAMVLGVAGTTLSSSAAPSAQSRAASCDAERKACLASKAQTGSYGARYVAPDDVAACQAAYRMCVSGH